MANEEVVEGSWGIDPVPPRLRVLSGVETGLLWGNLGVSLLVIVAGAILVPALSLPSALVAIVVGCLIGNAMLGVAGMIGADARVPGMALMRAPLGRRGSLLPTGVNVLQGILASQDNTDSIGWIGLASPGSLVDGLQSKFLDGKHAFPGGPPDLTSAQASAYALLTVVLIAGTYALLLRRYRKAGL